MAPKKNTPAGLLFACYVCVLDCNFSLLDFASQLSQAMLVEEDHEPMDVVCNPFSWLENHLKIELLNYIFNLFYELIKLNVELFKFNLQLLQIWGYPQLFFNLNVELFKFNL